MLCYTVYLCRDFIIFIEYSPQSFFRLLNKAKTKYQMLFIFFFFTYIIFYNRPSLNFLKFFRHKTHDCFALTNEHEHEVL